MFNIKYFGLILLFLLGVVSCYKLSQTSDSLLPLRYISKNYLTMPNIEDCSKNIIYPKLMYSFDILFVIGISIFNFGYITLLSIYLIE